MAYLIVMLLIAVFYAYVWTEDFLAGRKVTTIDGDLDRLRKSSDSTLQQLKDIKEETKRLLNPTDEDIAMWEAHKEIMAIEIAAGLWDPVWGENVIPAKMRKEKFLAEPIEVEVWNGQGAVDKMLLEAKSYEFDTREVLVPEQRIPTITGWKPVEGFVP